MNFVSMAVVFLAVGSYAQTAKSKTAPVVPVELREKFFKAQAEFQGASVAAKEAASAAQAKNTVMMEQIEKIKTVCGADFAPNTDKDGEIICQEKPKAAEPAKK